MNKPNLAALLTESAKKGEQERIDRDQIARITERVKVKLAPLTYAARAH